MKLKDYIEKTKDPWGLLAIRVNQGRKREIIKHIGKSGMVLDVGGGFGFYSEALRLSGRKVFCLDFSKRMISDGREMFPKVNFILADGCRIPIKNNSMNAVLCMGTLIYVRDRKRFIREVHRVLKKDGKFLLMERNKNYIVNRFIRILKETEEPVDNVNNFLTKREIKMLLSGLFTIKKISGNFSNFLFCVVEKTD